MKIINISEEDSSIKQYSLFLSQLFVSCQILVVKQIFEKTHW